MPLIAIRFVQGRTSARAATLGLLFVWAVLPWPAVAQTLASKYRGFGVVHVKLNPPDNSGQPSIDVELVNGAKIVIAAYGMDVFTQYADGTQSVSHETVDLSPGLTLRQVFPRQQGYAWPNLQSLLPRQHTVFHSAAGQNASGSPPVSARAAITAVVFADGAYTGDPGDIRTLLNNWGEELDETNRWLSQVNVLGTCTSVNVSQAAGNLSAQIAASTQGTLFGNGPVARKKIKQQVDLISNVGQAAASSAPGTATAALSLNPATTLDPMAAKRIAFLQQRAKFLSKWTPLPIGTRLQSLPTPAPVLTNLSQNSATVGDQPFTLALTGANFVNGPGGTVVQVNGAPRTTTFVSGTQLTIPIGSADLGTAQLLQIAVLDPTTCYGPGAALSLTVSNGPPPPATSPIPSISSISPTSATAGSTSFTLTVNGTNFVGSSAVQVNGSNRATAFVSATQLTAAITASDLATPGILSISVVNPAPGGGSSGTAALQVSNPLGVIFSLSPTSAQVGGGPFTLTVNGTNFLNSSVVQVGGNNRATTFVNAMQLTVSIPASDIASAGTLPVKVVNPSPAGVTSSAAATFTVNNPLPGVTSISPNTANAGGAAFTLAVNGMNFLSGATVAFNGTNRTTTFVSATQLTASIPASDIATGGNLAITVANPAPTGGVGGASFKVYNLVPALSNLSPINTIVGGSAFPLSLNGTNFVSTSVVQVNGSSRTTTFVSPTQLTASIPASDVARTGTLSITVLNPMPGGGTSAAQSVAVNDPVPVVSSLSPNSATVGGAAFTLTVNGANFVSGATVQVNGSNRTTTFASATQLTASIPASDNASAGTFSVTVVNPAPGGGTSAASAFTVNNPVPTISSLSPTSATAGAAAFTLTVNGTSFLSGATVKVNGNSRTTTFISATQLTASIPASDLASAGTLSVTVVNPTPNAGPSAPASFTVIPPPAITSLSPSTATAGGAAFTLTVNGTNFVSGATVKVNGGNRTTTSGSVTNAGVTQLTASIPASDITSAGTLSVTVVNPVPGGGTSAPATFTVNNPAPTISSLSPSSATAGGAAFTLTVNGTNFVSSATVKVNGNSRTTTFVSGTQLTASVSASYIASAGTLSITVVNPAPGGGASAAAGFTVNGAGPAITTLSPQSVPAGGPDFTLTITGSGFVSGATVSVYNSATAASDTRSATFISSTQLTLQMFSSDIASPATITFWAVNPQNGGCTSACTSNPANMNVQ